MRLSRIKTQLETLLFAGLLFAAAALIYSLIGKAALRVDLSEQQTQSLSTYSKQVLDALSEPLEVVLYARSDGQTEQQVAELMARYERYQPQLRYRFHDITLDPEISRKLQLPARGAMILRYQDREQRLQSLSESKLTHSIQRLLRQRPIRVGVITGHGERSADGQTRHDFSALSGFLAQTGIEFQPVFLAQSLRVPEGLDLLLIASPTNAYFPGELAAIENYLNGGGNLLWLKEPSGSDVLSELEQWLGIYQLPGTVIDPVQATLASIEQVGLLRFDGTRQTAQFDSFAHPVLLPQAAALLYREQPPVSITPLFETSPKAWTEQGSLDEQAAFTPNSEERTGLLHLGLLYTREHPHKAQRIVVIGDGDFLSNAWLGNGGNRAFAQHLINALADPRPQGSSPTEQPEANQHILLSRNEVAVIGALALILLPSLYLLIASGLIWQQWRPRQPKNNDDQQQPESF